MGQSKMDNPEKLATKSTQDEDKLLCVGHHHTQADTNNVNKT